MKIKESLKKKKQVQPSRISKQGGVWGCCLNEEYILFEVNAGTYIPPGGARTMYTAKQSIQGLVGFYSATYTAIQGMPGHVTPPVQSPSLSPYY